MANNHNAVLTWAANTEPDLVGYKIYYGLYPGLWIGSAIVLAPSVSTTLQSEFTADGLWYFAITAYDTSNNESAKSTAVSKRIIRTGSHLKRRG